MEPFFNVRQVIGCGVSLLNYFQYYSGKANKVKKEPIKINGFNPL